jgi:hypothetical protein
MIAARRSHKRTVARRSASAHILRPAAAYRLSGTAEASVRADRQPDDMHRDVLARVQIAPDTT